MSSIKDKIKKIQKTIGAFPIYRSLVEQMLFNGCQMGNIDLVKTALVLGADVNTTKKVGEYSDSIGGRGNPTWSGTINVTPLIYTAANAFGEKDEKPYKDIINLLAERGADTSKVISGVEKYWEVDQWEINGDQPDKRSVYTYSLADALGARITQKYHRYNTPYEYCSISDSMATYMAGLFNITDEKTLADPLKNKEGFLNDFSAAERERRADDVAYAQSEGAPLTAKEVMKLRKKEELKRLNANKLRLKLKQR